MNQIDTRPQQVASVLAYRENSLPLITNVNQEDDISGAEISVELQNSSGKMLYVVTTFTVMGQIILVNFTRQQVKAMPAIAHCVIIINGVYSYGFKITPQTGFGIPQNNQVDITINLKGDKGDPGDLTAEAQALKTLMDADVLATASDRLQTGQDRAAVDTDKQEVEAGRVATEGYLNQVVNLKSDVTTLKSETNQIKSDTNTIKTDTIAIKGQTQLIQDQTALDRTATGSDRTQTGLDRTATGADRVQTGLDVISTNDNKVAAGISEVNANASFLAADQIRQSIDVPSQNLFSSLVLRAIKNRRATGKKIGVLHVGDSLVNGAGGGAYRDTFDPTWQKLFGRGGTGFIPFNYDQMATLLCGSSASGLLRYPLWGPGSNGWTTLNQANTNVWSGEKLHSFSGTITYRQSASGQKYYVGDPDNPFTQVTLFYLQHTGTGQISFGKDGDLQTINCGGASVNTVRSVKRRIWSGLVEDSTALIQADSGDVYLLGLLFETDLPSSGISFVGGVGGISASKLATLDETSFRYYIRTLDPTVVTLDMLTNDRTNPNPTQSLADYTTVINRIRAELPTVPILIQIPNNSNSLAVFASVFTALKAMTDVCLFYWKDVIGTSVSDGIYIDVDQIHPTERGCAVLGKELIKTFTGNSDMIPRVEWPFPNPDDNNTLLVDYTRNGDFSATATDWTGSVVIGSNTLSISSVGASSGGVLQSSFFGGNLIAGQLYSIEVDVVSIDSIWLLYDSTGTISSPFLATSESFNYFTSVGTKRYVYRPDTNKTNLRLICAVAGKTLVIKRFSVKKLISNSRFSKTADNVRGWFPGSDYTGDQKYIGNVTIQGTENVVGAFKATKIDPYFSVSEFWRYGSLTAKNVPSTPIGTPVLLYNLGFCVGYPDGEIEIRLNIQRAGAQGRVIKKFYISISNTTIINKGSGVLMATETKATRLSSDARAIDANIAITNNSTTGLMEIWLNLTGDAGVTNLSGFVTATYSFGYLGTAGQSVFEN